MTFIYVVYILTFVSAVVMLFLSVVLMLPSSAVSVPKKAIILFLIPAEEVPFSILTYFFLLMFLCVVLYLLYALYVDATPAFSDNLKVNEKGPVVSRPYNEITCSGNYAFTILDSKLTRSNHSFDSLARVLLTSDEVA